MRALALYLRYFDTRRSLAAAIGWLAFALSIGIALVASVWVGDIVVRGAGDEARPEMTDAMADAELADDLDGAVLWQGAGDGQPGTAGTRRVGLVAGIRRANSEVG